MRSIKGSVVGLALAGILALGPTAAFAHGGGGGFGGGGGHFGGGGGHFGGFAGHSFAGQRFAGHSLAEHQGAHFARHEDQFRDRDHFRHDGDFFFGDAFSYDYPY